MRPALKILLVITIFAPTGCDWNSDSERDKTATASIEVLLDQRRRARADICVKEITELLRKMSARGGQTPSRMRDVVVNSFELIELARLTPNAEQSAEFKSELVGLLPGYQSLIEKMALKSSTLKEFENQFGGDGKRLAWIIASIRGITLDDYQVELSNIITPSLTACPICEGMVSIEAHACPHCGLPLPVAEVEAPNTQQSLQFLKSQGLTGMRGRDAETLYKGDKDHKEEMARRKYLASDAATSDMEKIRTSRQKMKDEQEGVPGSEDKRGRGLRGANIYGQMTVKDPKTGELKIRDVSKYKADIDKATTSGTASDERVKAVMDQIQKDLKDEFGDSMSDKERGDVSREIYDAIKEGKGEAGVDKIIADQANKNAEDMKAAYDALLETRKHLEALGFTKAEIKKFEDNAKSFEKIQQAARAVSATEAGLDVLQSGTKAAAGDAKGVDTTGSLIDQRGDETDDSKAKARRKYLAGAQSTADAEELRTQRKILVDEHKGVMGSKDKRGLRGANIYGQMRDISTYEADIKAGTTSGTASVAKVDAVMDKIQKDLKDEFGDSMADSEREAVSREIYDAIKDGKGGKSTETKVDKIIADQVTKNAKDYQAAEYAFLDTKKHLQALGFSDAEIRNFEKNAENFEKIQKAGAAID